MPCLQLLGLLCDKLLSIEIILDAGEFPGTFVYRIRLIKLLSLARGIRDHGLHAVYSLYFVF